jgi:chromate transport protein ChrA
MSTDRRPLGALFLIFLRLGLTSFGGPVAHLGYFSRRAGRTPPGVLLAPGSELFAAMYRAGALVFGGRHVVLPLLETETVRTGWVSPDAFLPGYGAAQALPGPLFAFAAFLGTLQGAVPNGWVGGVLATIAIFLPAWMVVLGAGAGATVAGFL